MARETGDVGIAEYSYETKLGMAIANWEPLVKNEVRGALLLNGHASMVGWPCTQAYDAQDHLVSILPHHHTFFCFPAV